MACARCSASLKIHDVVVEGELTGCENCIDQCDKCNEYFRKTAFQTKVEEDEGEDPTLTECTACHTYICSKCARVCVDCEEHLCPKHRLTCVECKKDVCEECGAKDCHECRKGIFHCAHHCPRCDNPLCDKCALACENCKETRVCGKCGVLECPMCGFTLCDRCGYRCKCGAVLSCVRCTTDTMAEMLKCVVCSS
jgi:hypothetical protein